MLICKLPRLCLIISSLIIITGLLPDCSDPEKICETAVEIAATAIVRCESNSSLEQTKQALMDEWALGSCKTIKKIRDIDSLVNDCLPWLEKVSCNVLLSGRKLPACENQLLMSTVEL